MSNARPQAGVKLRDDEKVKHIPVTIIPTEKEEMLASLSGLKLSFLVLPRRLTTLKKRCARITFIQCVKKQAARTWQSVSTTVLRPL